MKIKTTAAASVLALFACGTPEDATRAGIDKRVTSSSTAEAEDRDEDCRRDGNLLVDPGFECQTPAAQGGWTLFGGTFSTAFARHGRWSMLDAAQSGIVGSFQQLPAAPGSRWRLTGHGLSPTPIHGAPAFGIVQLSFFDAAGNDLGTVETANTGVKAKTSNPVDATTPAGKWTRLDTGMATAPAGAAFVQAFTLYVDFTGLAQGVYFDDLRLTTTTDDEP